MKKTGLVFCRNDGSCCPGSAGGPASPIRTAPEKTSETCSARTPGGHIFSPPLGTEAGVQFPHVHAAVGVVRAEGVQNSWTRGASGVHDNRVVGIDTGMARAQHLMHDVLFAPRVTWEVIDCHWPMPFNIPTIRERSISLSSRSALRTLRIIRGDGLVPKKFRLTGGPHW